MKDATYLCKELKPEEFILRFKETKDSDGSYILTIIFANGETKKEEFHDLESLKKRKEELIYIEEAKTEYIMKHHEFNDKNVVFASDLSLIGALSAGVYGSAVRGWPEIIPYFLASVAGMGVVAAGAIANEQIIEKDVKKNDYFISYKAFINDVIKNNPEIIVELIGYNALSRGAIKGFRKCIEENRELTINDIEKFRKSDFENLKRLAFYKCAKDLRPLFTSVDFADYFRDNINAMLLDGLSDKAYKVIEDKNISGEALEMSDIDNFTSDDMIYLKKLVQDVKRKRNVLSKEDKGVSNTL